MTIVDIINKLNEDWGRYKYPLIIKVEDDTYKYIYILFTYQGLFWCKPETKEVRYIHPNSQLYEDCKVLKIFYVERKGLIDRVLKGAFTESDERDAYEMSLKEFDSSIENSISSEDEERTQDLMNKFGLV